MVAISEVVQCVLCSRSGAPSWLLARAKQRHMSQHEEAQTNRWCPVCANARVTGTCEGINWNASWLVARGARRVPARCHAATFHGTDPGSCAVVAQTAGGVRGRHRRKASRRCITFVPRKSSYTEH